MDAVITVPASVVRDVGITPWRIALWAKAETRPDRRRNLLAASVAMLQAEITELTASPPESSS